MENKQTTKLSLKKETITRLNDEQLMKFVGGTNEVSRDSCDKNSCDSQTAAGSCTESSCNCKPVQQS